MANYNVEINYLNEDNEYDTLFPSAFIPRGIIVMWSGAKDNIPNGWLLCDGTNNTPDLRNKFVLGAGSSYNVGATGGAQTVSLSISQMPSHNHSASTSTTVHTEVDSTDLRTTIGGSHAHTYTGAGTPSGSVATSSGANPALTRTYSASTNSEGNHDHLITGTVQATSTAVSITTMSNTGSGTPHENMPPYYALCYLMKE